jgi:adenylate cyclase
MKNLPKKQITFFFCDVEGSTKHLIRLGEKYARIHELYQATIRKALHHFNGSEVDTAGDGFFGFFPDPGNALLACLDAQTVFSTASWARDFGFKVRMGVHTGKAILTVTGFLGLEVHRASRICSAAHGGQILFSQSAFQKIRNKLPPDTSARDLGAFRLKDFDRLEHLYQIDKPGLTTTFPLPRTELPMPTVAVLPFTNLSGDPDQQLLCDGITEEIIIALGKTPGLQVVARSSVTALRGQQLDAVDAGRKLNAKNILEGTVRKIDRRIRVTAELVDVQSGYNLWSEGFNREMKDLFTVQDEIAQNIAAALRTKLDSRQVRGIEKIQTNNITAYNYYLEGRQEYNKYSPAGIRSALHKFRSALAEDDQYALAYCGLANCYSYLFMYVDQKAPDLKSALVAGKKAIEIDPLLAEAYVAYGQALSLEQGYAEAESAFERAIDIDPLSFDAHYIYARVCFAEGKLEKAARLFEEAFAINSEDYQSPLLIGQVYESLKQPKKADAARRKGVEAVTNCLQLNPNEVRALYMGANGLVALGEQEKGLQWLDKALSISPDDSMLLYNAGCIYALAGQSEVALANLERSIDAGLTQKGWFENDSNLDSLRKMPRFEALLERLS